MRLMSDHAYSDVVEVSLNSVADFTTNHMLKFQEHIGNQDIMVLIDSGTTRNFQSISLVERSRLRMADSGGNDQRDRKLVKEWCWYFRVARGQRFITQIPRALMWLRTSGDVKINWKLMTYPSPDSKVTFRRDPGQCGAKASLKVVTGSLQRDG